MTDYDSDTPQIITPGPDGDGVILHLPEITYLDTQAWSVDIGLTHAGLAALRALLHDDAARQASGQQPDNAEAARTPCSFPVCDDGPGEPCDRHEREMSHDEGSHELCGPECAAGLSDTQPAVDRVIVRCTSCDHEAQYHDADGRCWFTVEQGVPGRDCVCACQRRRMADEETSR